MKLAQLLKYHFHLLNQQQNLMIILTNAWMYLNVKILIVMDAGFQKVDQISMHVQFVKFTIVLNAMYVHDKIYLL